MKSFDVAVIGGGIIGASIAFELAADQLRVVVLDRQQPGQEASWAAAGMLSPAPDSPKDIPLVPLSRESLSVYGDFVAAIEEASGQSTGYAREDAIEIFSGEYAIEERDRRVGECARWGLEPVAVSAGEARSSEKSVAPNVAAAICFHEGTIEPRLLISAALEAARNRGVEIRANSQVTELAIDRGRCGGVTTRSETISAGNVILAAGCFSRTIAETGFFEKYAPTRPVRGQMIALRPDGSPLKHVLRSERGYIVPRRDGRVVAGSTSEETGFEKRVTAAGVHRILDNAIELCPALAEAEILETWCGLRPGTPDDLPIIGPTDIDGFLIATGHYRNGILLSAVTAKLLREWLTLGRTSFNAEAFSPLRFTTRQPLAHHAR